MLRPSAQSDLARAVLVGVMTPRRGSLGSKGHSYATTEAERRLLEARNRSLPAVSPEATGRRSLQASGFVQEFYDRAVAALERSVCRRCGGIVLTGGDEHAWRCR